MGSVSYCSSTFARSELYLGSVLNFFRSGLSLREGKEILPDLRASSAHRNAASWSPRIEWTVMKIVGFEYPDFEASMAVSNSFLASSALPDAAETYAKCAV